MRVLTANEWNRFPISWLIAVTKSFEINKFLSIRLSYLNILAVYM